MRYFITIFFCFILCFFSCDEIEPPYQEPPQYNSEKTVLIEKFTGHKCSNCPEASRKLDELQEFYPNQIIAVSIHPGSLSSFTEVDAAYPYNFTTIDGNTIADSLGAYFIPVGAINRIPGGISNRCWLKDDWANQVQNLLYNSNGDPLQKDFDIVINTSLNEENKELTIETNTSLLNDLEGNYNLCLIIIEDGIISPQLDDSEYIENYEHNHIYRCAVNSIYGQNINEFALIEYINGNPVYESTHTLIFNENHNMNWTESWNNINNCYVIAYVYNTETGIIQETVKKNIINE